MDEWRAIEFEDAVKRLLRLPRAGVDPAGCPHAFSVWGPRFRRPGGRTAVVERCAACFSSRIVDVPPLYELGRRAE